MKLLVFIGGMVVVIAVMLGVYYAASKLRLAAPNENTEQKD